MIRCITVDIDPTDVYFRDIADQVAETGSEAEMLEELANSNESFARMSGVQSEKKWCLAIAEKLRETAKWLKENGP